MGVRRILSNSMIPWIRFGMMPSGIQKKSPKVYGGNQSQKILVLKFIAIMLHQIGPYEVVGRLPLFHHPDTRKRMRKKKQGGCSDNI